MPPRDGVSPTRVRLPREGRWACLAAFLTERFPPYDAGATAALFARGDVLGPDGGPLGLDAPYEPGGHAWVFRPLPPEAGPPIELPVLHEDEHLLVVDKPHGLAVTPRGAHVRRTVVTALRASTGNGLLTPAHRLDRLTAGVLLLAKTREARGPLQALFETQRVAKAYEALAPLDPPGAPEVPRHPAAPLELASRIDKRPGVLQAREVEGPPNAFTAVSLLREVPGAAGRLGLYRAMPRTGKTHQIRVHLSSIGRPILGDPLYPRVLPPEEAAELPWLQLLARGVSLTHPLTGERLSLRSARTLEPTATEQQRPPAREAP
ncbi:pseudouridine synthase [Rothia sp. AR01]|uniref:RNA pseudouridylate synthase n=1 Tax=Rothia santali TaxID=2949643 RepID=A0A9X2KL71_9MICC|nr:pseudouridine synthase [Rothia santali]MCP3425801.1 pseudouridine synthase [Rothia santali]